MNHSISPRELRRWHAWIRVHQHPLDAEFYRLFRRWKRMPPGTNASLNLAVKLNNLLRQMKARESNPARHDPRNGGAI